MSYIALSLGDPLAWSAAVLAMVFAVIYYIYLGKFDKEKEE